VLRKPNFTVDADSFQVLRDDIGMGRIVELGPNESSLVAPHIAGHPETIYAAASGVQLSNQYGVFRSGDTQIAVEWIRQETRPMPKEPECNAYRYLFGLTSDGKCVGVEVTEPKSSDLSGQVADHWTTFDDVVKRHFPATSPK
jgi:hypothetical protein